MKLYIYTAAAVAMVALPVVVWQTSGGSEKDPVPVEAPMALQIETIEEPAALPVQAAQVSPASEDDAPFSYDETQEASAPVEPASAGAIREDEPETEQVETEVESPAQIVLAPVAPLSPPPEVSAGDLDESVSVEAQNGLPQVPVLEGEPGFSAEISQESQPDEVLDDGLVELDIPEAAELESANEVSGFTDIQKEAFVFVLPQVLSLTNMYAGLISAAAQSGDEEEAANLQGEFTSEVLAVIDDSEFLDRELYAQMSERMLTDAAFEVEISERLRAFGVE
jgi:hypothetical protein